MTQVRDEPEAPPAPTACPFCRSSRIVTTAGKADASSYWRCEGCGQVWNVARLRPFSRHDQGRRW